MKPSSPFLNRHTLLASLTLGLSIQSSFAATQYWSGTGTWNTTNTNWSANLVPGGPYTSAWANTTADIAVFEGTGGTVTIGSNVNVDRIDFNATGYILSSDVARTLTGAQGTNYNLAANVTATIGANLTVQSSGTNQNWNIAGASRTISILNIDGTVRNNTTNASSLLNATVNVRTGGQLIAGSSVVTGTATTGSGSDLNIAGTVSIGANASSIILNNTGAITANSSITISSGGNLTFTDAANTGGIRFGATGGSNSALSNLSGTLNLDGGTTTINSIFMGGAYTAGARYTAIVNLNGGILKALRDNATFFQGITNANNGSTGSGAFVRAGGALFDSNGKAITVGQVLETGVAGPTLDGGLTLNDTAVTKGTLTLSAANTYTGLTTVTAGALNIASTGSIKSGNALTIASAGTANFANEGQTLGAVSNANTTTNALNFSAATGTITLASLTGAGNTRFGSNGTVTGGIATGTVNAVGLLTASISGGTVSAGSLSATNVSDGTTTVSGTATIGTLTGGTTHLNGVTNSITTLNGGTINLAANSILTVSNGITSGSITGSGRLIKTSSDTLTLSSSGTYTYTGATNVNAGKLVVNGNISTSNVTVADGATLGGSGFIGALTVESGGFVGPGNSPGTLTVNGNYTQAGTLIAEVMGLTAGTQYDQLNVLGTVTLSGELSLDTSAAGNSYTPNSMLFLLLNDEADAINGAFSNYSEGAHVGFFGGFDWIITYQADSTTNSFTGGNDVALLAIPEPSAALLSGLGILALLSRRRPSR